MAPELGGKQPCFPELVVHDLTPAGQRTAGRAQEASNPEGRVKHMAHLPLLLIVMADSNNQPELLPNPGPKPHPFKTLLINC